MQDKKIYVIRKNDFPYNDSWMEISGYGDIHATYTDKEAAINHWKKLIQIFLKEDGGDYLKFNQLFHLKTNPKLIDELDQYVIQCCRESIFIDDPNQTDAMLPDTLSLDQSIEFLKRANLLPYEVFEYSDREIFSLIWLIEEKDYLRRWHNNSLIFGTSIENLFKNISIDYLYSALQETLEKHKLSIDQLTDSPQLLLNLIQQKPYNKYVHYDPNTRMIELEEWDVFVNIFHTPSITNFEISNLNTLLKHPIFQIHEVYFNTLIKLNSDEILLNE